MSTNLFKIQSLTIIILLSAGECKAALYDRGNGLIFSDLTNTTWTQDANLFATQALSNAHLVQDILTANFDNGLNASIVHDTPNGYDTVANSGTYSLSTSDFDTSTGTMNWWGAKAWITYLNSTNYKGTNQWRLPTESPNKELVQLFNTELKNPTYYLPAPNSSTINPDWTDKAPAVFQDAANNYANNQFNNINTIKDKDIYWYSTENSLTALTAWNYRAGTGYEVSTSKSTQFYAWAVHNGDIGLTAVPIPAVSGLFSVGLGLLALGRKRRI